MKETKNKLHRIFRKGRFVVANYFLILSIFFPVVAFASLYSPGATLEPDCAPNTSNCGVLTFNINNLTSTSQSLVVGQDGTDFSIVSSSSIHTFNLPTASALNRGLLSPSDWTVFNNKLSNVLNTGKIFVGDGSNQPSPVTMSGAGSLNSAGVFSLTDNSVVTSKILSGNVTYDKLQRVGSSKILGNPSSTSTVVSEINIGSGLIFSGDDLLINSPTCASNQRLSWNGSAFECKTAGIFSEVVDQNSFLLGPVSGGGNPTFRSITSADLASGTSTNQEVLLGNMSWLQLFDGSGKINSSVLPSSITGSLKFQGHGTQIPTPQLLQMVVRVELMETFTLLV